MFSGLNPNPFNTTPTTTNPYNPNPNPYNTTTSPYAYQPVQNINIDGKQIPSVHGDTFKKAIDQYNQLQWDPQLQNLIALLQLQQQKGKDILEKAKSDQFSQKIWDNQANKAQNQYIKDRCLKIKKRNQKLLVQLLNIRQKICSQMYMYRIPSKAKSLEMEQICQKMRDIKYQVKLKYSQLKVLKMNKQAMEDQNYQNRKKPTPVDIPLNDLKKGAEVLEKQKNRLKQQFNLLQKVVHGERLV